MGEGGWWRRVVFREEGLMGRRCLLERVDEEEERRFGGKVWLDEKK